MYYVGRYKHTIDTHTTYWDRIELMLEKLLFNQKQMGEDHHRFPLAVAAIYGEELLTPPVVHNGQKDSKSGMFFKSLALKRA